jgi:hypothetical protein
VTQPDEQILPDGTYLIWRGRTYRGSLAPTPGEAVLFATEQEDEQFTPTRAGRWRRTVPLTEVELFELTTRCRWKGEIFSVGARNPDGLLLLGWSGGNQRRAEELGLTRVDKYTWETAVPESEVTDLRQERLVLAQPGEQGPR